LIRDNPRDPRDPRDPRENSEAVPKVEHDRRLYRGRREGQLRLDPMKIRAHRLMSAVFLAACLDAGAAGFEGRVIFEREVPPAFPHSIVYQVKSDRNRVEVVREGVKTFMTDVAKEETTAILEDERMYVVLPSLAPRPDDAPLQRTDETATLQGRTVRKHVHVADDETTELWLAEGLGKYTGFGEGFERPPKHIPGEDVPEPPPPRPWEFALAGTDLFPLRVITRDAGGRVIFRLEAKAVQPEPLNDRLFAPSSNYQKVEPWPKYSEA
jgi:hypothetical protein